MMGTVILTVATLLEENAIGYAAAVFLVVALFLGLSASSDFKGFFLVGALPAIGGLILTYVFFRSCLDYSASGELRVRRLVDRPRPAARDRDRLPADGRPADALLGARQPGVLPVEALDVRQGR